jgi:hypothetical protein
LSFQSNLDKGGPIKGRGCWRPHEDDRARETKSGWNDRRNARLAFLIGRGKTARQIAADPDVNTSSNAVYQQARRLGLRFRDVPNEFVVSLSPLAAETFTAAAKRRSITSPELLKRLVEICALEPHLLGNILDDA